MNANLKKLGIGIVIFLRQILQGESGFLGQGDDDKRGQRLF
jgi:hypothetical protein